MTKQKVSFAIIIPIAIGLSSSGCGLSTIETTPLPEELHIEITQSYPLPRVGDEELVPMLGYPLSTDSNSVGSAPTDVATIIEVPTPSNNKIVITGRMLSSDYGGPPYVGDIYLGFLIEPDQKNYPPMIKFSEEISPKGIVDAYGKFYFSEVEPGDYALIIYSLGGTYIVQNDNGETLYIHGIPGQTYDLGTLIIP